jgi:ABC-type transporter Mla subunit MlaD
MANGAGFLQHVLGGITAFAQQQLAERRLRQERLAAMRDAIEQVVEASEPRIRLVGDYADKLVDAVETALNYCEKLTKQLPPALTLDARAWATDARVNAFFATVADLRATLSHPPAVRQFFEQPGRPAECFALMLMVKRETETFGTTLAGDLLVREVRQVQVSFSEHQLHFPAASETQLRRDLRQRMLVFLASRARERIDELRMRRNALEEQRRQLRAQLQALRGQAGGLRPLLSSADADERRLATLEQRLTRTEQDLAEARKPLGTLDNYLEQVRRVIGQPEPYLRLHPLSLRLNRLGVKLDEDSPEPGEIIPLFELDSLDERRIGALVRFVRAEWSAETAT